MQKDDAKEKKVEKPETVNTAGTAEKQDTGNGGGTFDIEKMSADEIKILAQALIIENTDLEKQFKQLQEENGSLKKLADKAGELSVMYTSISKDFDVYRKRNAEIESVSKDNAIIETGLKIVPVYDNLRRAAEAIADEKIKEGIMLIYKQFTEILLSMDIKEFGAEGDVFDPYKHNALMAAETDDGNLKGKIKQVFSAGYIFKDKVIKQSQVIVYKE